MALRSTAPAVAVGVLPRGGGTAVGLQGLVRSVEALVPLPRHASDVLALVPFFFCVCVFFHVLSFFRGEKGEVIVLCVCVCARLFGACC